MQRNKKIDKDNQKKKTKQQKQRFRGLTEGQPVTAQG